MASLSEEGGAVTAGTVGRPPATQQSKVSFAEGTTFERERTSKFQCPIIFDFLSVIYFFHRYAYEYPYVGIIYSISYYNI